MSIKTLHARLMDEGVDIGIVVTGAINKVSLTTIFKHLVAQRGQYFKYSAKRDGGIWDTFGRIAGVTKGKVTIKKREFPSIKIDDGAGNSLYVTAPFVLENEPTDTAMLLFHCGESKLVRKHK